MGPRQLDLAQATPIAVPLRFFLTVPLFATPAYPAWLARRFGPAVLAALVAWSQADLVAIVRVRRRHARALAGLARP